MFGLKFNTYGVGVGHMPTAPVPEPCPRCQGRGRIGSLRFPACCPDCAGSGVTA